MRPRWYFPCITAMRMRPCLAAPLLSVLLFAATGCDLVSDPGGPRPEDFEVQEETSEVRSIDEDDAVEIDVQHDVAAPLSTARGGSTLSLTAPR